MHLKRAIVCLKGRKLMPYELIIVVSPILAFVMWPIVQKLIELLPSPHKRADSRRTMACARNLRQIGLAMAEYEQDAGGKLPPSTVGGRNVTGWDISSSDQTGTPVGWADAIQSHLHTASEYLCPTANMIPSGKPALSNYTCYWLNSNLAAIEIKSLTRPQFTVECGEGFDGIDINDATYSKSALPASWLTDRSKPSFRHLGGANYLFVDGHVKWLRPDEVTHFGGRVDAFAVR